MDQEEYLSIAEFAKRVGLTPQGVYKQLNNRLSTYVKVHNGKKRISTKALELFLSTDVNQVDKPFNNKFNNVYQPVDNQTIEILKEQLDIKDKQIEQLQQDLRTSREDLARLATELAKIADQGQHLQMKMMLPDGQQTTQQPEEPGATAAPIQDAEVIHESTTEEQHPIDGKKDDDDIVMGGRLDGMPDIPSSFNWWMVVAIVAIIALIAGVLYYLWDLGYF